MANTCLRCLFKTCYCLYARTCVGRCVHNRMLKNFRKNYGDKTSHTSISPFIFGRDLLIVPMPYLLNNYCYVVADIAEGNFVFIDVGDANLMKEVGCPDAILTTHRHWDHSGGNKAMRAAFPGLKVYGGHLESVPDHTHKVDDRQVITFGRLKFTAIWTPGHTKGHIVWQLDGSTFGTANSLFTGDHIMLGCCGAHFEGPTTQMVESLNLIKTFDDSSWVWPGHEAALMSLQTAVFVDPSNLHCLAKLAWVIDRRRQLRCTCPSTLGEEKSYNPFLRTDNKNLQRVLGLRKKITETEDEVCTNDELKMQVYTFERIVHKSSKFPPEMTIEEERRPDVVRGDLTMEQVLPVAREATKFSEFEMDAPMVEAA